VWPLLGPSTHCATPLGRPLDVTWSPSLLVAHGAAAYALSALQPREHPRQPARRQPDVLTSIALDKYVFVRDSYLRAGASLVYDGDPPERTL
jgi:ABC-type transporter lipoprotein component MlaA